MVMGSTEYITNEQGQLIKVVLPLESFERMRQVLLRLAYQGDTEALYALDPQTRQQILAHSAQFNAYSSNSYENDLVIDVG